MLCSIRDIDAQCHHPVKITETYNLIRWTFRIAGVCNWLGHKEMLTHHDPCHHASGHVLNVVELFAEYMPHMSLLYGHLSEEELELAKAKVEAEHGKQLISMQFQVSSLGLYCTDPADVLCNSWKKVCQLPLRAPDIPVWCQ